MALHVIEPEQTTLHGTYSREWAPSRTAALANLTVDLRITQLVNGVRGVHALLPHGALNPRADGYGFAGTATPPRLPLKKLLGTGPTITVSVRGRSEVISTSWLIIGRMTRILAVAFSQVRCSVWLIPCV